MTVQGGCRRCARHPQALVTHACDGCGEPLCAACVEVGHALDFCRRCGERALPVVDAVSTPAPPSAPAGPASARSYGLRAALSFPFKGRGRRIYPRLCLLTVVAAWLPTALPQLVMLVVASSLSLAIVHTTSAGDDEPPPWPSPWAFRERFADAATWLGARLLQLLFFAFLIVQAGGGGMFRRPPSALFWLVAAISLWLGTALGMASLGAAGTFGRIQAANLLGHVRGCLRLGTEAVNAANLLFGLGAVVLLGRAQLSSADPGTAEQLLRDLLAGLLAGYWLLLEPHLVGVLFRRNRALLATAYGLAPDDSIRHAR